MTLYFGDYIYFLMSFFYFWYVKAPFGLFLYFRSMNNSAMRLLSLRLLVVTFFKPWKNEYRKDLVGFSIIIGIFIKTLLIIFDLSVLIILFIFEMIFLFLFLFWPFLTIYLLFK